MIIFVSLLIYTTISISNNHNILINDEIEEHPILKGNIKDDNSTISTTPPPKKKFPFTPVIVSSVFVLIVLTISIYFLCKKLKQRKFYTNVADVEKQEREMELMTNSPITNVMDKDEPNGIITINEEEKKTETPDPEENKTDISNTEENKNETPEQENKTDTPEVEQK